MSIGVLIFGVDIPWWAIVGGLVAIYLFRNELKSLLDSLLSKVFVKKVKPQDEQVRQLVLQALQQHGLSEKVLGDLSGERLVQLLRAFVAFASALTAVTPNKVDDVVIMIVSKVADFLDKERDVANVIANILNRIFGNKPGDSGS